MKRKPRSLTVEELFPNARARKVADEAIDKLDPKLPMTAYLDAFESAYVAAGGKSPFRNQDKS
jgi:hypothetical protein